MMKLERNGILYRCGNIVLCPDPPEHELVQLYVDWKKSDVMNWVFYGEPTSLQWFLNWFSRPDQSNLAVYKIDDQGAAQVLGLIWINTTFSLPGGFTRAEVAMGFSRNVDPSDILAAGWMAIEWGFEERKLDALIGTTPVPNRAAIAFGRRLGFEVAGPVHGMCTFHGNLTAVMLQSMDKAMWSVHSPFQENYETDKNKSVYLDVSIRPVT